MASSTEIPQIITFDYQFAPNAQKARNLLTSSSLPFKICEQPFVQPRPTLTSLGITYRRIPVNAIGKDIFCDNRTFYETISRLFPDKAPPSHPSEHAFESFGYRTFWVCLPLVPKELLSEQMSRDRYDLYHVFSREDYAGLRPSALAELRHFMDIVERDFLGETRFINNETQIGMADLHAMWMIKWALQTIGVGEEPGFGREAFPKVWRWIEGVKDHDGPDGEPEKLDPETAKEMVLGGIYAVPEKELQVDENDPTGLKKGELVTVATNDDDVKENRLQAGKLVGLNTREIVIQLENNLRLHFPRIGYVMKKFEESGLDEL